VTEVSDIENFDINVFSYECICGGSNMADLAAQISAKVSEITQNGLNLTNGDNQTPSALKNDKLMKPENFQDSANNLEIKEKIIEDLITKIEEMKLSSEQIKISKKSLDTKFYKSVLIQRLSAQVKDL
jgi:hypothetical protein